MWSSIGNVGHVAVILNSLIYCYIVIFQRYTNPIFDAIWREDGFCVTNKEVPYWNSHDMCFYADIMAAIFTIGMYKALHKAPGMKGASDLIKPNIIALIGHGIAHSRVGKSIRDNTMPDKDNTQWDMFPEMSLSQILAFIVPLYAGLTMLLKGPLPFSTAAVFGFVTTSVFLFLPPDLVFTYVITSIFMSRGYAQLRRPAEEKEEFSYAMWPLVVYGPLGIVAWIEATSCASIIDYGGHLLYDLSIPFFQTIFYLLCFTKGRMNQSTKIKTV